MPNNESTEEQVRAATNAYQLLRNWKTPPGIQPDGTFSPKQFKGWLDTVVRECTESGHLGVALSQVGQMLIYSPPDPDGLWIHHAIADALDSVNADDMRRGYYIGRFNARGAHCVDPSGAAEKELEAKLLAQAEALEANGYTRFPGTIRSLAATYAEEAERIVAEHCTPIDEN